MKKRLAMSALLLGAALIAGTPSSAAPWRHPGWHGHPGLHPHARFAFRHDFRHFTPLEHRAWLGGRWHHTWWHGRYGWWWGVGGAWYFYNAPVYPYPAYVSPTYYDEDDSYDDNAGPQDNGGPGGPQDSAGPQDEGGGPDSGVWYHCNRPDGYYPYVRVCKGGWEEVPATPEDMQGGPQGGPDMGPGGASGAPRNMGPGGSNYGPPPDGQGGYPNDGDGPPPPPPGR